MVVIDLFWKINIIYATAKTLSPSATLSFRQICKYISMAKASIISHVELSEWQDCSGTQLWIAGENGHHK